MIVASDVELRQGPGSCSSTPPSGSRPATGSASSAATVPARPPSPRPGRRGAAGRRHRDPLAARSATCRRTRAPATSSARPRPHAVRPGPGRRCCAGCARPRARWPAPTTRPASAAMERYGRARRRVHRPRRLRGRERGGARSLEPRAARARARASRSAPCPAASAGGSSWRGSSSPAPTRCCSTSPPTTSTPTRSLWLRDFLEAGPGGLVVISHDVGPARARPSPRSSTSTRTGPCSTSTTSGWKAYLEQRETDERRRKRERANAEKKAATLMAQADKMRAKATKATAAQNMAKRAERLLSGLEETRRNDRVAKLRFPDPAPCGRTPLTARGPVEVVRQRWRCSPTSTSPSTGGAGWWSSG